MRATTRPAVPADAPQLAALRSRVLPHLVRSEAAVRHRLERADGAAQHLLAVLPGGEVVGAAAVVTDVGERAWMDLLVAPEHRRRGLGTELFAWALGVSGDQPVEAVAVDSPDGIAAVRAWGLVPSAPVQFSRTDPRGVVPVVPDGAVLTPLDDPRVRTEAVHALLQVSTPDDPSGLSLVRPLEQWHADVWLDPDHDPSADTAAWDGEQVCGDDGRERSSHRADLVRHDRDPPGCARARPCARGEVDALARAAGAGCTQAWTGNASDNAPMLAVNRRLGYEVAARGWVVHGERTSAPGAGERGPGGGADPRGADPPRGPARARRPRRASRATSACPARPRTTCSAR